MNNNPTKKQHYIPKFYLRLFTGDKNLLQVLDMKRNRLALPRTPSGVGYEKYFYAAETGVPDEISQHIEEWFQVYENTIAQELPVIIEKILNHHHIDDDDKYILSALMCMLWLRSPSMRTHLNKMNEDVAKKMMSFYVPQRVDAYIKDHDTEMSEEKRARIIKTFEDGSYRLKFNNAQHLQFMTKTFGFGEPGFTNMFFGQKWKIYLARGEKRFITTDSPVVEWWLPTKMFYGASFPARNKYFALTPDIFIELTYSMGTNKVKRETLFENRDDDVLLFNILLAAHSHEYVYSGDRELLERLVSGREKPGALERAYYDHYQKPWNIAKKEGWA